MVQNYEMFFFFHTYNAKEIIRGNHSLKDTLTWEHYFRTNFIPNAKEG